MTALASLARFNNYTPASFGWDARDPERDSSLLVPFTFDGVLFEGGMNRDVVGVFTALLEELVPLIEGGLIAGQCGDFNPNSVTVGGQRSFHTYGTAIDVNWGHNPMFAQQEPTGEYALPPQTSAIARKYGCEWGGDWTYPQDWMHIEVHLTPADARAFTPTPAPPVEGDDMAYIAQASDTKQLYLVDGNGWHPFSAGELPYVAADYGISARPTVRKPFKQLAIAIAVSKRSA